ncbi:carboxymuconolactone decarboxylase family protein [Teichococcus oryzae]|uniref:Carboxymuconolactone decarboxylase family protein n=1 Tax=Teichococcus oryzae TaxID=1608942 RepID=A0A5B2TIU4_9PROT|nr:carboxymuconolactone decarboxylase family protein [Pseudoroseomonas oryzae]KAA2214033.1 carboxymuconolactone decarboxylase family protein [Pseudoroseomonas oryzae]
MARIPYADPANPETRPLVERIIRERGSVLHLYAMLLHSGPVAEGWLRYLTAIRHECALPGLLRELVIMRIAHLNGAPYEAEQHAPIALKEGMSQAQIDALPEWRESDLFDATQQAVLAYCDSMTREIHVPDAIFSAVREALPPRELVELTATIGAYNMVSRFLEAMGVDARDPLPGTDHAGA